MTSSLDMGLPRSRTASISRRKPEGEGYYKRAASGWAATWAKIGRRSRRRHRWATDYCAGDGLVVFARDVHLGWGNVVIVGTAYREAGT